MSNASKKTGKIVVFSILGVLLVLIIIVLVGTWSMFGTFIKAGNTISKLEDGLYSMEYRGDYGLDQFIEQGGASSDAQVGDYLTNYLSHGFYKSDNNVQGSNYGCSTICTTDIYGNTLFGRNFDWEKCKTMIVHTIPENGYESISTCNLDFLGFGMDYTPDGSMAEKMQSLASIYVPLDGMNVKGLMIADLVVGGDSGQEVHQNTGKEDVTTTTAIRLMLDKCKNVDEAIELLQQYDMNSSNGAAHHYAIADSSGKSVVVEYVDGQMLVTDSKVVTNFYLCDSPLKGIGSQQSHERYNTLMSFNGVSDMTIMKDLLESVAQKNYPKTDGSYEITDWSIVYNPSEGGLDFYFREDYNNPYHVKYTQDGNFVEK